MPNQQCRPRDQDLKPARRKELGPWEVRFAKRSRSPVPIQVQTSKRRSAGLEKSAYL